MTVDFSKIGGAQFEFPEDELSIRWKRFSSVPYHIKFKRGRMTATPQHWTDTGSVKNLTFYTFDTWERVIMSARNLVIETLGKGYSDNQQRKFLGGTAYLARCGPPIESVFYWIGLDD